MSCHGTQPSLAPVSSGPVSRGLPGKGSRARDSPTSSAMPARPTTRRWATTSAPGRDCSTRSWPSTSPPWMPTASCRHVGRSLRTLVDAIVGPTADLLATDDGRDFLRIMEQLADWSGVGSGRQAAAAARHGHRDAARGTHSSPGRAHRSGAGARAGRADGHLPDGCARGEGSLGRGRAAPADVTPAVRRPPRRRAHRSTQPTQRPSRSSPSVISSALPAKDSRTNSLPRRVSKSIPGAVATPVSSSRRRHQE